MTEKSSTTNNKLLSIIESSLTQDEIFDLVTGIFDICICDSDQALHVVVGAIDVIDNRWGERFEVIETARLEALEKPQSHDPIAASAPAVAALYAGTKSPRGKSPYWMKHVKEIDPSGVSGYAFNGDFLNRKSLAALPDGNVVLLCVRGKTRSDDKYHVCARKTGEKLSVTYDSGSSGEFDGLLQAALVPSAKAAAEFISATCPSMPRFSSKKSAA